MAGPKLIEGAKRTDLSLVARVREAYRGMRAGFQGDFLPAGDPQQPQPGSRSARLFDLNPYRNQQATPRAYENVSFAELRQLSRSCDLLRIGIEEAKDQQSKVKWSWRVRPEQGEDPEAYQKRNAADARIDKLNLMFRYPDRFNTFREWQRMVIEDMLVLDAVCIEPRFDALGELVGLDLVDGATIVRMVDNTGRTPVPPKPAYQQVLHGMISAEFSSRDLLYVMRNPSTDKVYGYPPAEQILMTVNQALRRGLFQLSHYTEGNMGMGFIPVPDTWSTDDVKEMQAYWDILVSGKPSEQSKIHFIPYGNTPIFPQAETLKDEFDEWLARIICKTLKISPNAFIKNLNRATGESQRDEAAEDGLMVRTEFMRDLLENAVVRWTEWEDVEAVPEFSRPIDSLKQAQADEIYIRSGVYSVDEVRQALGKHPIGVGHGVMTSQGLVPFHKIEDAEGKVGAMVPRPEKENNALGGADGSSKTKRLPAERAVRKLDDGGQNG